MSSLTDENITLFKKKVKIVICEEVSQQSNDYDCGVYLIVYFQKLLTKFQNLSSRISDFQDRFRSTLNNKTLTNADEITETRNLLKNKLNFYATHLKDCKIISDRHEKYIHSGKGKNVNLSCLVTPANVLLPS